MTELVQRIMEVLSEHQSFQQDDDDRPCVDDLWRCWLSSQISSFASRLADSLLERDYRESFVLCVGVLQKAIELGQSLVEVTSDEQFDDEPIDG